MRVLQAIAGAAHGGAEAFFTRLVLALARSGVEQRALIRGNPSRAAALRQGGVQTVELAFGGRLDLWTARRFRREAAAFGPDVVLTWMSRASRLCPAGPFVHVGRLGGYYDLKYYRRCDHLIGNTQDIVRYIVSQGWPAERAHHLPNFVPERPAEPAAERAALPPGAPLLLALGRLHANKGFDVLLRAVAGIPEAWLWLAGEGPERGALEALAEALGLAGRVRFLGWREDVPELMAAADILVCPSRHEPLGNVVLEGWAQRVPVVAAASQGPAALIRPDETGLLVPVDDPAALAEAIRALLADPGRRGRLAAGGRAAFDAAFTEAAVVAQYRAFFERVTA